MTDQQKRVNALIERIEKHQAALRLRDYPFAARYQRYLGSGKTWTDRLRARQWSELDTRLDKWEKKLNEFVAEIETGSTVDDFVETLPIVRYVADCYQLLAGQRNDRRCVLIIGPTGVGKTVALHRLHGQYPQHTIYMRFWPGMNGSLPLIARTFARALGCTEEASGAKTFDNVLTALRGSPVTVIVEDIHEGGVLALKLVKTAIDESKAKFILSTYPTAYRRLVNGGTEAMSEAQQLLGRSIKPINQQWIKGLTASDISAFLAGSAELPKDIADNCARNIVAAVRASGNLRVLADALADARLNADDAGEDLSVEYIEAAVAELCKKADAEEAK